MDEQKPTDAEKAQLAADLAIKMAPVMNGFIEAFFTGLAKLHTAIHGAKVDDGKGGAPGA